MFEISTDDIDKVSDSMKNTLQALLESQAVRSKNLGISTVVTLGEDIPVLQIKAFWDKETIIMELSIHENGS